MARIAFCECGWTDPVNSSASIGGAPPFNGWYWLEVPQVNNGFTGGIDNPIGLTSPVYFSHYWNFRTISIEYDITVSVGGGSSHLVGAFSVTSSNGSGPLSTETDLVTSLGIIEFTGTDGTATFSIKFGDPTFPLQYDMSGGLLFPPVEVKVSGGGGYITFNTFDVGAGNPQPFVVVSSNTWLAGNEFFANSPATSWVGTFSADVTEYWGYDSVFDTATGAELITPPPQGL